MEQTAKGLSDTIFFKAQTRINNSYVIETLQQASQTKYFIPFTILLQIIFDSEKIKMKC